MTPFEIAIVEVSKLSMKPGDILALRVDGDMPQEVLGEIYIQMERLVPVGVKIAVVPNTTEFQIITPS
jgi:hypothetical protein